MLRFFAQMNLGLLLFTACLPAQPTKNSAWKVRWEPTQLVNGSPVLFRVTAPAATASLQGVWLGHTFSFRFGRECHCWYAIAGIGLETRPGKYPLKLQEVGSTATREVFAHDVPVIEAHYPTTAIKVAPQYVEPPKEIEPRIAEEQALKKQIFSVTAPEELWSGTFEKPARAEVSGVFGSARTLNGVKRNQHTGLDFRVSTGTPVVAANGGTVILARNLYFEGNCVAIDHGQGLVTLYLHLSEFKVKEGDKVKRGELVGLSGGTGRATAPHLHFAVRWQGIYLNPATLLELTPP